MRRKYSLIVFNISISEFNLFFAYNIPLYEIQSMYKFNNFYTR